MGALDGVDALRSTRGPVAGTTTDVIIIVVILLALLYGLSLLYD